MDQLEEYIEKVNDMNHQKFLRITSISDNIKEKYSKKITELESAMSNIAIEIDDIKTIVKTETDNKIEEYQATQPKHNKRFVDILYHLIRGDQIFFVEESENIEPFKLVLNGEYDDFIKLTHLPEELQQPIYDWIKKNVEVKSVEAIQPVSGQLKGYKGRDTEYEANGDPIYIKEYGNAEACVYDEWEDYFDDCPNNDDIEYDQKECWSNAVIRKPVTLIFSTYVNIS